MKFSCLQENLSQGLNTCTHLAGTSRMKYPASILPIRVMCSSRVDPMFIVKTFLNGADGVLIGGCHPGDCHYQEGNYHTRRRFVLLTKVFDSLGLDTKRLKLSWISASEGPKFAKVGNEYTAEIKSFGENPTRTNVFL